MKQQYTKLIESALKALKFDDKNIKILGMLALAYKKTGEKEKTKRRILRWYRKSYYCGRIQKAKKGEGDWWGLIQNLN